MFNDRNNYEDEEDDEEWHADLQGLKENNPETTELERRGEYNYVQNMADDGWEELGQDIASNTHLRSLSLYERALNDHKLSCLFRRLTRSSSIRDVSFSDNGLSAVGLRSMVPFLQNANNLTNLDLEGNNIQSEGFNLLFRSLRDSPIYFLHCGRCGIESIEIDNNHIPEHLTLLNLSSNFINADGCRGLEKLLQGGNATLKQLHLYDNKIDDDGVEILADALQNNTSLTALGLVGNDGISKHGMTILLKLVNDVSSINATLQSNHTLSYLRVKEINHNELDPDPHEEIQTHVNVATEINGNSGSDPEAAGKEKVIQTLLHSMKRSQLCRLQGIDRSLYSEIDHLHLPEVLSLIGQRHGEGELYAAVLSSIMTLCSTMNREKCIQQERDYHAAKAAEHIAKVEELDKELATIKEAIKEEAGAAVRSQDNVCSQSNKRRRT
mmetsp:Transcript_1997/g.3176  ORF Transcript_1997/g.3176 Transcript_1997/m.3176 type:complete len:440 (-) Transcript_1997:76-1395(-)